MLSFQTVLKISASSQLQRLKNPKVNDSNKPPENDDGKGRKSQQQTFLLISELADLIDFSNAKNGDRLSSATQ